MRHFHYDIHIRIATLAELHPGKLRPQYHNRRFLHLKCVKQDSKYFISTVHIPAIPDFLEDNSNNDYIMKLHIFDILPMFLNLRVITIAFTLDYENTG